MTSDDNGSLSDACGVRGSVDGPLLPTLSDKIAQMPELGKGAAGDLTSDRRLWLDYAWVWTSSPITPAAPINCLEPVRECQAKDDMLLIVYALRK